MEESSILLMVQAKEIIRKAKYTRKLLTKELLNPS